MKTLVLLVLLVLCISSISALQCNHCVPASVGGLCLDTVVTCRKAGHTCGFATYSFNNIFSYFKRCMGESEIRLLRANPSYRVQTCSTDRCN